MSQQATGRLGALVTLVPRSMSRTNLKATDSAARAGMPAPSRRIISMAEGTVPAIGNRFAISEITWFRRVDLSGAIDGDRIRVTGDWDGNYLRGECQAVRGQCQLTFQTTGIIYSAFISLSVR